MYNPNLQDVEKLACYTIDDFQSPDRVKHTEVYKITLSKPKSKKPQSKTLMSRNIIRVIF